jgi:hypothetical protein
MWNCQASQQIQQPLVCT